MSAQLEPIMALGAAMAGAAVAMTVVGGPWWLLLPGALGALLPGLLSRWREPRDS